MSIESNSCVRFNLAGPQIGIYSIENEKEYLQIEHFKSEIYSEPRNIKDRIITLFGTGVNGEKKYIPSEQTEFIEEIAQQNLGGSLPTVLEESLANEIPDLDREKVKQRVEEAGKNLDLSSHHLTRLPLAVCLLTKLEILDLSFCQLRSLPKEVGRLENLSYLNLMGNYLEELPEEIGRLKKLEECDLTANQINNLPEGFKNLTKITSLFLSGNQLDSLPPQLTDLPDLSYLNLSENNIKTVPADIQKLSCLTELDLDSNHLASLPAELAQMSQLRVQRLGDEEIENKNMPHLWERIVEATSLEKLHFTGTPALEEVPAKIGQLTNLRQLDLSLNQIQSVSDHFGYLTNLEKLNLYQNEIEGLPFSIGSLLSLEHLDIAANPIAGLPLSLGDIPELTVLNAEDTSIPPELISTILTSCREAKRAQLAKQFPAKLEQWALAAKRPYGDIQFLDSLFYEQKKDILDWLKKLGQTKDFSTCQETLAGIVYDMLITLVDNAPFKEQFFAQINVNNTKCGDRGAMGLNVLYTSWRLCTMEKDASLQRKLELLEGVSRTLALRNALSTILKDRDERETTEIYLYYELSLKDKLGLDTAIDSMLYPITGKKAYIAEESLICTVEENWMGEIVELPAFKQLMTHDKDYQDKEKQIVAKYEKEFNALMDEENPDLVKFANRRGDELKGFAVDWLKQQLSLRKRERSNSAGKEEASNKKSHK